jgi:YHS domain-containing protein
MIDPVCKMEVEPNTAAGKHEYNGNTYLFCSIHCVDAFKKDPERFLKSQSPTHSDDPGQAQSVVIDPVCGMNVDPSKAAGKYEHKGQLYYFCSLFVLLALSVVTFLDDSWQSDNSIALAQSAVQLGERIYQENCVACHGVKGDGKGLEAQRLKTKPRGFTSGIYKFRSTPSGSLPLDQDIFRTVTQGVRGTSIGATTTVRTRKMGSS